MLARTSRALGALQRRGLSTSRARLGDGYGSTIGNLRIDGSTRVMYQGFTGQAATANARDTIEHGTRVVGGVTPGKGGQEHLGLPVLDTVREVSPLSAARCLPPLCRLDVSFVDVSRLTRQAVELLRPDVSAVFVPAAAAAGAIVEAVEAQVSLVVAVAEHVPAHDLLRVHEVLRTQSRTRLVGPNSPGVMAPGRCRVGIMPWRQFRRGRVGIVSRSGTLSYEAAGATTAAGLGQSLVVAVGSDAMPGTTLAEALAVLLADAETEGVVVIGEIGGDGELRAAEAIAAHRRAAARPKPVVAMVAGHTAPRGRTMGHAGAMLTPRDASAADKADALRAAGAVVVPHPGVMGATMRGLLATRQ